MSHPIRVNGHDPRPSEFHHQKPLEDFLIPKAYGELTPLSYGAFGVVARASIDPHGPHKRQLFVKPNEQITQVAVKRIAADVAYKDPYRSKQTYREIVLMKKLHHDNLVRMVDLFSTSSKPAGYKDIYIVTEAMDTDLGFLINSPIGCEYELDASQIQYITHQMFKALKYIHSAEVLHRDLKPQNILVHSNLKVQICDFGLARTNQPLEGSATGYVTTMWYRAPEVMLTWQHYTSALDIWSAGCIFAEMHKRLNYNPSKVADSKHIYALFPADNHVEHLEMILSLLGPPCSSVLDSSSGSILSWVKGKMDQVRKQGVKPLSEQLQILDEKKGSLLSSLLSFDPKMRISATDALEHPYITTASWRPQRDAKDERDKLVIQFDETDVKWDPNFWEQVIEKEIENSKDMLPQVQAPIQLSPAILRQLTGQQEQSFAQQHQQLEQHQQQQHQQHQQHLQQHSEQRFQAFQQQLAVAQSQLTQSMDVEERKKLEDVILNLEQEIASFTRTLLMGSDDMQEGLTTPTLQSPTLSPPLHQLGQDSQITPLNTAMSEIQIDHSSQPDPINSIGFPESGTNAPHFSAAPMVDNFQVTNELLAQLQELSDVDVDMPMELFAEHKDETVSLLSSNLG